MSSSDAHDSGDLKQVVRQCLDSFYTKKLKSLRSLTLTNLLLRKNPYLYRALGIQEPSELVAAMVDAYISSSDETIFGKAFFEEVVLQYGKVRRSGITGTDFIRETEQDYVVISLKSGPHAFSASQYDKQNADFTKVFQTLREQGIRKHIDLVLGMSYGQVSPNRASSYIYRISSGRQLWQELTDDPEFYIKLLDIIGDYSVQKRVAYQLEKSAILQRFTAEFISLYTEAGIINWTALVNINAPASSPATSTPASGNPTNKRTPRKPKT